jgi:hypothetical protein
VPRPPGGSVRARLNSVGGFGVFLIDLEEDKYTKAVIWGAELAADGHEDHSRSTPLPWIDSGAGRA